MRKHFSIKQVYGSIEVIIKVKHLLALFVGKILLQGHNFRTIPIVTKNINVAIVEKHLVIKVLHSRLHKGNFTCPYCNKIFARNDRLKAHKGKCEVDVKSSLENFDNDTIVETKIPNNYEDLLSLPGVGNYTASAILAIAFNKPYIPLDGNIERVLKPYLYLKK